MGFAGLDFPPEGHFLRQPIVWAHSIWNKIVNNKGNETEIRACFNLFPIVEAHIEDLIGLRFLQAQQHYDGACDQQTLLQDPIVATITDHWKTDKIYSSPSVFQQVCMTAKQYKHILSQNYYFPLLPFLIDDEAEDFHSTFKMANNISGTDFSLASTVLQRKEYEVDYIDLDKLDSVIARQQEQDGQDAEMTQDDSIMMPSDTDKHTNLYRYRISIRRLYRQRSADTLPEAFKKFVIALKHVDKFSAVRPFYVSEANKFPPINSGTQVQRPELINISRYHQSWTPNQKWALTGNMVLESSHSYQSLHDKLSDWLYNNNYTMSLSECQTSELVTVGILTKFSFTLNKNDLTTTLQNIISDLPEEETFLFTLRLDKWFCRAGEKGGVDMLFVAVERAKIQQGIAFFCRLYDGVNKKVPDGHGLWFVPTYQIEITDEVRERIGQEQRSWRGEEVACFVTGFHDLSTRVKLRDGSTSTIRNLLYCFPTNDPTCPRKTLIHGIDRCPIHAGWIYIKYNRADAHIFRRRAKHLASDINKMLEDGEEQKVFTNIDVGIQFGGEITKTYSVTNQRSRSKQPSPADAGILDHFHSIINKMQNVAMKRSPVTPDQSQHRRSPQSSSTHSQTYATATRAASTTYTSTMHTSEAQHAPRGMVQTTTQSVTVIEERYERRFVGIENLCRNNVMRIEKMEKTTTTTAKCIQALLEHQGIVVDLESNDTSVTSLTGADSGSMEVEQQVQSESGTKRIRQMEAAGSEVSTPTIHHA